MTVRYLLGNIYNSVIFYIPVLAYHLFGTVPYNVWLTGTVILF